MSDDSRPTQQVLNAHPGLTNIIPPDEIDGLMRNTFEELAGILSSHCGPRGKFAMLIDVNDPTIPPRFTQDGINIIRSLEFINPMQRIVRDELAHIGQSIERSVGDGTTSAVMVAVEAFLHLSNSVEFQELAEDSTFEELRQTFRKWSSTIKELLDSNKITLDELDEYFTDCSREWLIDQIVYWQAMVSSHGDQDLARAATGVFSQMPEEAWDKISFVRESTETSERIRLEEHADQYVLESRPLFNSYLNRRAGSEFELQAGLIILNTRLNQHDTISYRALQMAQDRENEGKATVIVCPQGIDQVFIEKLRETVGTNTRIFVSPTEHSDYNPIVGLQCVSGISRVGDENDLRAVEDASLVWKDKKLYINNLYNNEDNSLIHPDADNEYTYLGRVIKELDESIDMLRRDDVEGGEWNQTKDIQRLRELYMRIKYTRRWSIHIGGSARDNSHTFDVVSDTLMASKNSLQKGFLPASNLALIDACMRTSGTDEELFSQAFMKGSHTVLQQFLSEHVINDLFYTNDDLCTLMNHYSYFGTRTFNDAVFDSLNSEEGYNVYPGIEPANLGKEILDKFEDVVLKYLYTSRIVAPGGVYTDKTNSNQK